MTGRQADAVDSSLAETKKIQKELLREWRGDGVIQANFRTELEVVWPWRTGWPQVKDR